MNPVRNPCYRWDIVCLQHIISNVGLRMANNRKELKYYAIFIKDF